jgi:arylsulfatase B
VVAHAAADGPGAARPLYLYLAWHLTHSPLQAPARFLDPALAAVPGRQLYHGMARALDEGVGNVTAALRVAGMWPRTLLVWSADNGGPLVSTGRSGNNYPLRGGKVTHSHSVAYFRR